MSREPEPEDRYPWLNVVAVIVVVIFIAFGAWVIATRKSPPSCDVMAKCPPTNGWVTS